MAEKNIAVLPEQEGYCTYMIGRKDEVRQMLIKILDQYEVEPNLAF